MQKYLTMKYCLRLLNIAIVFAFFQPTLSAQEKRIVGLGSSYGGSIYSVNVDGDDFQIHADFSSDEGMQSALSELTIFNNELWGVTGNGGQNNDGVIFKIDLEGNYTKLFDFDQNESGKYPNSILVRYNDRIWGTTQRGGSNDMGTIFSISLTGDDFQVEFHLSEDQGHFPWGPILENGSLWALCSRGGTNDAGTLIKINESIEVVYDFQTEHSGPQLIPVFQDESVYGVLPFSGAGEIFKLNSNGTNFEIVHTFSFENQEGQIPLGISKFGNSLVGTTVAGGSNGGGTLYSLDTSNEQLTYLHDFDFESSAPISPPIDYDGKYWGITTNQGVIYSIDYNGENFIVENNEEMATANGRFTQVNDKFYFLTENSGRNSFGSFLEFDPVNNTRTSLYDLGGENAICWPTRSLIAIDDMLYGMTASGGLGYGGIFSIDPKSNQSTLLYSFREKLISANNGLIYSDGNLIGTALYSSSEGDDGILFSFNPVDNSFTKLYGFDAAMGAAPVFELIPYSGKLYGVTHSEGETNDGVLFRIDPNGQNYEVLHQFTAQVNRILIAENKVYGASRNEGEDFVGYLFSFDLTENTFDVLIDFSTEIGRYPETGLTFFDGKLYGTTRFGPTNTAGSIFNVDTDGSNFSTVFESTNFETMGSEMLGRLLVQNNRIWGTTTGGGLNSRGILLSLNLDGTDFQVHRNLDEQEGATTMAPLITIELTLDILGQPEHSITKSYPNPVTNSLFINMGNSLVASVSIIDLEGRTQIIQTLATSGKLDVSGLSSGVYILRIVSAEGVSTQKIRKE